MLPPVPVSAPVGGAIPTLTPPPTRPSPPGEIRPGSLSSGRTTVAAAKPGSAKARLMDSLDGKAAKDPAAPAPAPAAAAPAERPGAAAAEIPPASSPEGTTEAPKTASEGAPNEHGAPSPGPEVAAEAGKGKKVSPWK